MYPRINGKQLVIWTNLGISTHAVFLMVDTSTLQVVEIPSQRQLWTQLRDLMDSSQLNRRGGNQSNWSTKMERGVQLTLWGPLPSMIAKSSFLAEIMAGYRIATSCTRRTTMRSRNWTALSRNRKNFIDRNLSSITIKSSLREHLDHDVHVYSIKAKKWFLMEKWFIDWWEWVITYISW